MRASLATLGLILLAACSTIPDYPKVDLSKNYRLESGLEVNGMKGSGFLIVPDTPVLNLKIRTDDDINLLVLNSCHREVSINRKDNHFELLWQVQELERHHYCPVQVYGVSTKGNFVLGAMHLQSTDFTLPFTLLCNGERVTALGTGFCQSREGLIQGVSFDRPVKAATSECLKPQTSDQKTYQYDIPAGFCVQLFRDEASGKTARLISYGYQLFLFNRG